MCTLSPEMDKKLPFSSDDSLYGRLVEKYCQKSTMFDVNKLVFFAKSERNFSDIRHISASILQIDLSLRIKLFTVVAFMINFHDNYFRENTKTGPKNIIKYFEIGIRPHFRGIC